MKRLINILLLGCACAGMLAAQSAQDSILQYFPARKGNLWKYELAGDPMRSVIVRSGGLPAQHFHNGPYDFFKTPHRDETDSVSSLNIDTTRLLVYSDSFLFPFEAQLATKPGDAFGIGGVCDSVRTDTVLGLPTTVRYFSRNAGGEVRRYKTAWKIGIVEGSDGEEFYGFPLDAAYRLTYAKIDGISYGQLLNPGEADSLAKYYPLNIGDVWIYKMTVVQPWQHESSRLIRKEVVSDTLIDGRRYQTMLTTDPAYGPPFAQVFRIDSASGNVYSRSLGGSDVLYDSLSAVEMTGDLSLNGGGADTVFGRLLPVRKIVQYPNIDRVVNRSAAWGFGVTRYGSETAFGMTEDARLVYAKIGGKEFGLLPTSLAAAAGEEAPPIAFTLEQNYPNPFNPSTTIAFSIPAKAHVSLKIFDMMGRDVATIVSDELPAGRYQRQWNASGMSSGVYFYRLEAGAYVETKRLILVK